MSAQTLRKKARIRKADFEKALEKLWVHGGVVGVAEDRLRKGSDGWQGPYEEQRARRVEQLRLMADLARGERCRMLSLVEHFGDGHDSGSPCGQCDVCAPGESLVRQMPAPDQLVPARTAMADRRRSPGKRGRTRRRSPSRRRASRTPAVALPTAGPSAPLVAALRAWRLQEAKRQHVPAFRVMTNRALVAIADARPRSAASLREVAGVGPTLLSRYGARLVALCTGGE